MTVESESERRRQFVSPTPVAPVLAGFDGEDGGRDALELARVLAEVRGAHCVVAVPRLDGLATEARAALADPEAEVHGIGVLSPADALIELARAVHAGTLVIGCSRADRLEQVLIRTIAEKLLDHSPCEFVVAPRGYRQQRHGPFGKIAVAVDGMPESKVALTRAEDLAREAGASLQVLVAEDPVVAGVEAQLPADAPASIADVLEAAVGSVDPALRPSGRKVVPGRPKIPATTAKALVDACDPDVDLLVAGSRRQLERVLSGSVTKHLVNASPRPVLVIPHSRQV